MVFESSFILLGLVQIVAYFIYGCAGFGAVVVSAPFATSILGTTVGVPFGTHLVLPFSYTMTLRNIRSVSWKDLAKILIACAPGIILGQYLFYVISPNTAKIAIGAAVVVIALMRIYQHIFVPYVLKRTEETEDGTPDTMTKKIMRIVCLVIGGAVHGAFNIGGPLITVYTLSAVKDKTKFRNTMLAVWACLDTWNAVNQFINGAWTPKLWSALVVCWPFALVGFLVGNKLFNKINRAQFLRIVDVVLLAVGLNTLIRAVAAVI